MKTITATLFRRKTTWVISVALTAILCTACETLPGSFSERLAAGYSAVTAVRQGTLRLLQAGEIHADDAREVQGIADNARGLMDLADRAYDLSQTEGERNLDRAVAILIEARACVDTTKGVDFTRCVSRIDTSEDGT